MHGLMIRFIFKVEIIHSNSGKHIVALKTMFPESSTEHEKQSSDKTPQFYLIGKLTQTNKDKSNMQNTAGEAETSS